MSTIVFFILEFIRILFIITIGSVLLINLETWIFKITGKEALDYAWMLGIANIIFVFVVYRNILQFSGWFKSARSKKLNKTITLVLLAIASALIIIPLSTGCQFMKNETTDTISNTLEAQDLEGMKQKIKEAGFQQEEYSANKSIGGYNSIGEKAEFKLSKYKKGSSYYLILEFSSEENIVARTIIVQLDNIETTRPQAIYSEGLRPYSECFFFSRAGLHSSSFHFMTSHEGIDKQWVVFYMEAKEKYESSDAIHGEFLLEVEGEYWSGAF